MLVTRSAFVQGSYGRVCSPRAFVFITKSHIRAESSFWMEPFTNLFVLPSVCRQFCKYVFLVDMLVEALEVETIASHEEEEEASHLIVMDQGAELEEVAGGA